MHGVPHFPIALAASLVLPLVACGGTPPVDELPAGTPVTVALDDGQVVAGRLARVDADMLVVENVERGVTTRVSRTAIADVELLDPANPRTRDVIVPSGTPVSLSLETTVASDTSRVEDQVPATLSAPLVADDVTVAPAGSVILGRVTAVEPSGKVRGRASLTVRFEQLQVGGATYELDTTPLRYVAEGTKGDDATKIGIGAAAGAIVGGIVGGRKGAAAGAAIGGGGGTAVVLATPGQEVELASGTTLEVELESPLTVGFPAESD